MVQRRLEVVFLLPILCLGLPGASPAVTLHTVFDLTPGASFDVRQDGVVVHEGLASEPEGTLTFECDDGHAFEVTLSGPADEDPPAMVTDLEVGSAGADALLLRWTAVGDDGSDGTAAQYDLRYSRAPITDSTWAQATPAPGEPIPLPAGMRESLLVEGLASGTGYYFALKVADENLNWSEISNVAFGQTEEAPVLPDTTPPEPVIDLDVLSRTTASITLSWTAPWDARDGRAASYDLRRSGSPITLENWSQAHRISPVPVPATAGQPESLRVDSLDAGALYYLSLRSFDAAGNVSALSNLVQDSTLSQPDGVAPRIVADLHVVDSTGTSLFLRWATPADSVPGRGPAWIERYELRRSRAPLDEQNWRQATVIAPPQAEAPGTMVEWEIRDLEPGTAYYAALRACDRAGNWSGLSNVAEGRTRTVGPPPEVEEDSLAPAPVGTLAAYVVGPTTARILWRAVGDDGTSGQARRYELRWSAQPIAPGAWEGLEPLRVPFAPAKAGVWESLDWPDRAPGATYHVTLRVFDEAGNVSRPSNEAFVTIPLTPDSSPPSVPGPVEAAWDGTAVRVTWAPGPDPDVAGYQVLRRRGDQPAAQVLADFSAAPAWSDATATPGILYAYSVIARDSSGNLSPSTGETLIAVPIPETPVLPMLIEAVDLLAADRPDLVRDCARIRWSARGREDLQGYRLFRELLGGADGTTGSGALIPMTPEMLEGPGPHVFTDTPLPPPGSYRYWVEAIGSGGDTQWLDPVTLEIPVLGNALLSVSPNPTGGRLRLIYHLDSAGTARADLYDVTGRAVGSWVRQVARAGREVWDIADLRGGGAARLPAGVYYLRIRMAGWDRAVPIVLTRSR